MKLPASYSRRALRKRHQFFAAGLADDHIDRLLTPPYVSNKPQVLHHRLRRAFHKVPADWPYATPASASVIGIDADAASVSTLVVVGGAVRISGLNVKGWE